MPERNASTPEVRSEARGPHWIAWVPDDHGKPKGAVVLVGRTQEEAEDRARQRALAEAGSSSSSSSDARS